MSAKKPKGDFNEAYRLHPHEEELLEKRIEKNLVPFAILLVYYRINKSFPEELSDVNINLISAIAIQLNAEYTACKRLFREYDLESRTVSRHRSIIVTPQ